MGKQKGRMMKTRQATVGKRVQLTNCDHMTADLRMHKGTIEDIKPSLISGQPVGPSLYVIALDQPFRMSHLQLPEANLPCCLQSVI
jgi:hypothetical protein